MASCCQEGFGHRVIRATSPKGREAGVYRQEQGKWERLRLFPKEEIIPLLNPEGEENSRTRTYVETSGWGERRVTPETGRRAQGRATEYSEAHRDAETSPTSQGLLGITASVYLGQMNALLSWWTVSIFSKMLVARLNATSMYKEAERRGDWHSRRGEQVFRM